MNHRLEAKHQDLNCKLIDSINNILMNIELIHMGECKFNTWGRPLIFGNKLIRHFPVFIN